MPVYGSVNYKNNKKTTQAGGCSAAVKRKTNKRKSKSGYVSFKNQLSRVKKSRKSKKMRGGAGCGMRNNQKGAAHCHGDHKKMNMKGGAGCGMRNNQKGAAHCHGDHKKMNMKGGFIRDHSPMRSASGKRTCNN
jgi:hypothetical protein